MNGHGFNSHQFHICIRGRVVEGTGLIIRFPLERHWFEPSRMQDKNIPILILFFSRSNCKLDIIETIIPNNLELMLKLNTQKTIKNIESQFLKTDLPTLRIGDNVKIGVKIIEGDKERVQFYEGTIIAKKNTSINTTITVRKILQGIGVERIFLVHSPKIDSITVLRSAKVRRAKLYYLRNLRGKASRLKQTFK